MSKRTAEELAKVLGHKAAEIEQVDHTDDGAVVTGRDGTRLIVFDDNTVAWFAYGDKPPNFTIPVFNPATKEIERPAPPSKAAAAKK